MFDSKEVVIIILCWGGGGGGGRYIYFMSFELLIIRNNLFPRTSNLCDLTVAY